MSGTLSRRTVLSNAAAATVLAAGWPIAAAAQVVEQDLVDDDSLGTLGAFDVNNFGPPGTRAVKKNFVFPTDVDATGVFGADLSHHNGVVDWAALRDAGAKYVYTKSSQSDRARDKTFETNWAGLRGVNLPVGGYHFLTAGVPGGDQARYFAKRLKAVGLRSGDLQPVVDLEWDFLGKEFKESKTDYWKAMTAADIVTLVNDSIATLKQELLPLAVTPIVYTNLSWWDANIRGAVFPNTAIWISDYRQKSYENKLPRTVPRHETVLWQFTESGSSARGGGHSALKKLDCNRTIGAMDIKALLIP